MKILQAYQQRWRSKQRQKKLLLLIGLRDNILQASCWQRDCCLWRQERVLEAGTKQDIIEEAGVLLRTILLEARTQEGLPALLLLGAEQVYGERLSLPLLEAKSLRQAVNWEAAQLAPWAVGAYTAAFVVEEKREADMQVQLWAMELAEVRAWQRLADSLQLRLQAILADREAEAVQQAWFKGAVWTEENLLRTGRYAACRQFMQSSYWRTAAIGCTALSLLLYAGVRGGCYLAQQSVQEGSRQLQEYSQWRQRYVDSEKLAQELARYRQLEHKGKQAGLQASGRLEQLGRQLEPGCWLQSVQASAGQGHWQVEGRAADLTAVQRLLQRWRQDKAYGQVELLRSKQEESGTGFTLRLKERGL